MGDKVNAHPRYTDIESTARWAPLKVDLPVFPEGLVSKKIRMLKVAHARTKHGGEPRSLLVLGHRRLRDARYHGVEVVMLISSNLLMRDSCYIGELHFGVERSAEILSLCHAMWSIIRDEPVRRLLRCPAAPVCRLLPSECDLIFRCLLRD
jgi:hypothetical protein